MVECEYVGYHPKGEIKKLEYSKFGVILQDIDIYMVFGNHCPCPAPGLIGGRIRQIYPGGKSEIVAQKWRHLDPGEDVELRAEQEVGPFDMHFRAEVETEGSGITDHKEFTVTAIHNYILLASVVAGGVYAAGVTQEWW